MKPWRSRLSNDQSRRLLEHFVAGTPARTAAQLVGVNRNTARLFYHRVRELIAEHLAPENPFQGGKVEVDESLLEPAAAPGRQPVKQPVFALVRRGGKVYTAMVLDPDAGAPPRPGVRPDAIVYTDPPAGRASVLDVSRFQPRRLRAATRAGARSGPIDAIENFWTQARRHMLRYHGIPRRHFELFLKECEFRFNYGPPKQLLSNLKHWSRRRD